MNYIETIKNENGTSGRMYVEKYVKNNYPEIYNDVIMYCDVQLSDLPFKQKVYHFVNNLTEKVYCKNPNCNNIVKYKNSTIGYREYCSIQCISSDPKIKKIKEEKSLKKYGTKAPAMNDIIKEKIINTNNARYGSNSPLQNIVIKEKSQKTLMKNYGVDNPSKHKVILNKRIESFKKSDYKINYKKTMQDRYGVNYPYELKQFIEKSKNTLFENYGVLHPYENKDILFKAQEKKKETWLKNKLLNDNIVNIDYENREYTMKCDLDLDHEFRISFDLLKSRKQFATHKCTICFPEKFNQKSMIECDLLKFIEENYNGEIIPNDRSIGKEIDVYLPKLKLGFEFNGLYWHNELHKLEDYHYYKTEISEKNQIKLIHIYEDDWMNKQDIVKSRILNIINLNINKIFARKTKIKEITDNKLIREFLDKNHLQGFVGSNIKLGLFFNDELVSLMTFGKRRIAMGKKSTNNDEYELLRFCNKLNINVVGGASKLFKYFINNYKPKEITTYADRSWSQGDLYYKLGFNFINKTQPNYYYVIDGIRKNRFNFRKDVLIKQGFDKNKTEREIMLERKIYRIYDSGQLKFIWKLK